MTSTITYRGQQFSVGPAQDPRYTEVRTRISLPVQGLRSVQFREGLEQRSQSMTAIQFAMIIEIEHKEDPDLLNDCIEIFIQVHGRDSRDGPYPRFSRCGVYGTPGRLPSIRAYPLYASIVAGSTIAE